MHALQLAGQVNQHRSDFHPPSRKARFFPPDRPCLQVDRPAGVVQKSAHLPFHSPAWIVAPLLCSTTCSGRCGHLSVCPAPGLSCESRRDRSHRPVSLSPDGCRKFATSEAFCIRASHRWRKSRHYSGKRRQARRRHPAQVGRSDGRKHPARRDRRRTRQQSGERFHIPNLPAPCRYIAAGIAATVRNRQNSFRSALATTHHATAHACFSVIRRLRISAAGFRQNQRHRTRWCSE